MKTLPDAIIASKGGNSERIILVRIIPESGDTWSEFLWATRDIIITDWESGGLSKSFAGGMLKENRLGTIKQSVDIREGGNVATVSGLTLSVVNPEYNGTNRFDQTFTGNLENRKVEIRLVFWTGSNPAWSDTLLLYKGVVEDVSFDYGTYQIKMRDAGFKRHKDIPSLILTRDDYPRLSDYNEGRVAPLVFGHLGTVTPELGKINISPIIRIDKSKVKYIASHNKSNSVSAIHIMAYFSEVNRVGDIHQDSNFTISYGRPTTLEFHVDEPILATLRSQAEIQGEKTDPAAMDFTQAIDDSDTTYFNLTSSQKLYLLIPIPSEFARIQDENDLVLYVEAGLITGSGHIKYYNPEWDVGVGGFSDGQAFVLGNSYSTIIYHFGNDKTAHGKDGEQADQNDPWTFSEIAIYEFGIECDAASSIQIKNISIRMMNMLSKGLIVHRKGKAPRRRGIGGGWPTEQIDFLQSGDNVFAIMNGTSFGAWIDQDSRNNGYDEGNLIRYGAYAIESILRDELDLTSSHINYEDFDGLGNTTNGHRKDWDFAFTILEQKNSLEIIKDFCRECAIIFLQNYENKESVKPLKKLTSVKTIDRTTIQEDIIKVTLSPLGETYNEFYLSYQKQYTHDSFTKTLFITSSDHNLSSNTRSGTPNTYTGLCSDSQSKYNQTERLSVKCNGIRDDATAELLIKWLAEWFCYRKHITEFKTDGLDHIDLEMGDQVKIDHTLLPTGISNDASFLLFDISHNLDRDRMKFKFMQVPELLP